MSKKIAKLFNTDLKVNSVDARTLWKNLGHTEEGYPFRKWIEQRLDDTMAESNVDFIDSPILGSRGIKKNCVIRIDYILTLNLAKEIAMLERNDVGKKVRKYFIQCESELLSKTVKRVKGDDVSELNRLMLDLGIQSRTKLEGKTDHKGYCIQTARIVNILCFGEHREGIRQDLNAETQARLNKILGDVARLSVRGITNPTQVYNELEPKYGLTKHISRCSIA
jgi:hypothetical protein